MLDPYRFRIEEGQVRRFAQAAWDTRCAALVAEGRLDALPPTYLGAAATIAGRPHSLPLMGFDVARAFHGLEVITLRAPVSVGAVLHVRESVRQLPRVNGHRGGLMRRAERQSEFYDASGKLVANVQRIILETETALAPERPRGDVTIFDDGLGERVDPVGGPPVPLRDLAPGARLATATFGPLTRTDFVRYAAASGDLTAVHFDEHAAASRGYAAPFAMGMLSAAFIGHLLTSSVELAPPWRLSVRFRDQVWPGDTLEVSGQLAEGRTSIALGCAAAGRTVTTAAVELGQAR